ncbi:hypothetical protein EIJ81_00985 (plasmid) [Aliivibrio salmonicida]|uniref:hypothetical protein n=1 Tax=Aliivibrio salmonicida TaxID=40269 RepID=UPI000F6E0054|nr:hypothetical protein [Aliivibrio salmonicida]AZL83475.1 hypothetical protein EIJ81_00985 [Aliivibrio salmonicida]
MRRIIVFLTIIGISVSVRAEHTASQEKAIKQVSEKINEMTTIILNNSCRFDKSGQLVNKEGCRDTLLSMKSRLEETNSYPEVVKRISDFDVKYISAQ